MRLPKLTYLEPRTIDELMEIKDEFGEKCAILAGGTDLIPRLKRHNLTTRHLINIKRIPELTEITYDRERGLRIGPAATLRKIIDHSMISNYYPLLVKAAHSVAFNQVRNMGTLGGNIILDTKCPYYNQSKFWWKSRPDCFKRGGVICYAVKGGKKCFALFSADTASALITLEAELIITSATGERCTPLESFYTGDGRRPHKLNENEVVTCIMIRQPAQEWKEGFLKKSHRGSVDYPIINLSVRLKMDGQALEDIKIALSGVSSKPIRAKEAERHLIGKKINEEVLTEALRLLLKEATPLSLIGTSAFIRRKMIEAMFADLLKMLTRDGLS